MHRHRAATAVPAAQTQRLITSRAGEAPQAVSRADVVRQAHVGRQSEGDQDADECPAQVDLTELEPEARRLGKGVMIAMVRFAESHQPDGRQIVSLHRYTIDRPALMAATMREV